MSLPDHIVSAARQCIGTQFQHQARIVGRGLDCAGVLVHVLKTIGAEFNDERGYPRVPRNYLIRTILESQPCLQKIQKSEMQTGDVLLMRFTSEPQHVAILAETTIIHAYSQIGRCVEHGFTDEWRRRVTDVYRVIA
jgi:cell wall-associated NlpC family hydrolase